ncbi:MAG: YqaA family protein [Deltaproteobacteria bacterium]|nr:YqaA family protein [Deltaproteobacteria bacterium]
MFKPLRKLYDWVLSWAHHPAGTWALFMLAVAESSFFPVPPDVLQIALGLEKPKRSFWYATVSSAGSVLGGVFGYFIGLFLYESVGKDIIDFYHLQATFEKVGGYYQAQAFWWIFVAAFTPIPFKVFTIAAGVYHAYVPLSILIVASAVGRPARFFLVAALIYFFGPRIKTFIDRYFNWLTVAFTVLLVGGFLLMKYL